MTIGIQTGGKVAKHVLPRSWDELTTEQALCCYLLIMGSTGGIFKAGEIPAAKRILLVMYLLGLDLKFMRQWQKDAGDDSFFAELEALLETADFLFDIKEEEGTRHYALKLGLTRCPYPVLDTSMKNPAKTPKRPNTKNLLYAPSGGLANITFYELATTLSWFDAYLASEHESQNMKPETHAAHPINMLLATLYRPAKPDNPHNRRSNYEGDRRLPLNKHESTLPKRAELFAKLYEPVRQLLLFWYASCRQAIIEAHPLVFSRATEEKVAPDATDYGELMLEMAGGVVHLDAVANQPYVNVLKDLERLEKRRRRQEQEALARRHKIR